MRDLKILVRKVKQYTQFGKGENGFKGKLKN